MQRNIFWTYLATIVSAFVSLPLTGQVTNKQQLAEAYTLERQGHPAAAIAQLTILLGSESLEPADTAKAWNVLGLAYQEEGDLAASQRAFERSMEVYEAVPKEAVGHAQALDDLAELYVAKGQLDVALRMMQRALQLYEAAHDEAGVVRTLSDLTGAFFSQRDVRQGRNTLERAVREARQTKGLGDDDLATLASLQGWLAEHDQDWSAALRRYQESLVLLRNYYGEQHVSTGWAYVLAGKARAETGDLRASQSEMLQGLAVLRRTLSMRDPRLASANLAYSHVLDLAGKRDEARVIRADAQAQLQSFRQGECLGCTVSAKALR